ncbi:MAG: prepilin-type N-terminal cleavage/methylation domain-containing protein [Lachnospiraceae bacterium]|nr:prepilin-type N-terminal cleavage/methylation domain-containing protein [Lachnospiraceae bacterium]
MKKLYKCNKGLTLVELMVSLAVFMVVITTVTAVLIPIPRLYARSVELSEWNTLLDNVANVMIADLSRATESLIINVGFPPDIILINIENIDIPYTVVDGILIRDGLQVLPREYYRDRSVSFELRNTDLEGNALPFESYILNVRIISNRDGSVMERDYAVRPLVLNQYG